MRRILDAFKYSFDGFKSVLKSEAAFREDLLVCVFLTPIVFMLNILPVERAFLIFVLILILFAECVNTAIEVVIDRISTETNPLSKKAKDIGSFIVLLSYINAVIAWLIILS
ncbi:MAG: diacylglycerol kinase [Alphaproteobacteria bacterium]|nr:diacylglycerol kinase [Alphaproteobacteria bacterium]